MLGRFRKVARTVTGYEVYARLDSGWALRSIFDEEGPAVADAAALATRDQLSGVRVIEESWDARAMRRLATIVYELGLGPPGDTSDRSRPSTPLLRFRAAATGFGGLTLALIAIVGAGIAAGAAFRGGWHLEW